MTVVLAPMCMWCSRKNPENWTCEAFPGGIPDDIFTNEFDHRKNHVNDNDLTFDPMDADAAATVEERWNTMHP